LYRGARRAEPPHHDNNQTSTGDNSTNISSIEATLAAIDSLELGEQFNYQQIAKKYGCDCTTLARKHQGVRASRRIKAENQQALYPQQEQELLRYINQLIDRGLPPTQAMIRRFASDIARREFGKGWVDRYIQRYNVYLISRWATEIDRSRY
jgi:hypothetical protein